MDDPKTPPNQAFEDQRERDKAQGNLREGGDGQPVKGGLTDEERGDQHDSGSSGDSDGGK